MQTKFSGAEDGSPTQKIQQFFGYPGELTVPSTPLRVEFLLIYLIVAQR